MVNLYGRRFAIEERFRDIKDSVSEWVSLQFRWESTQRRDRLLPYHRALRRPCFTFWGQAKRWECRDSSKTSNPAFTLCIARAKPICNFSQACPKSSPKSSSRRFQNYCFSTPKPQNFSPYCSQCPVEKNLRGSVELQPETRFRAQVVKLPFVAIWVL